jgi:hypothetical protein
MFRIIDVVKLSAPSAFRTSVTVRLSSPPYVGQAALARPSEGDISVSFDIDNRDVTRFLESLTTRGVVGNIHILFLHSHTSLRRRKTLSIRLRESFQRPKCTSNLIFSLTTKELLSQRRFAFSPLFPGYMYISPILNTTGVGQSTGSCAT